MTSTQHVQPPFFHRARKAFSAAGVGFVMGFGGSLTLLAESQEISLANAGSDILNTLGWGLGSAITGFIGVYATSNALGAKAVGLSLKGALVSKISYSVTTPTQVAKSIVYLLLTAAAIFLQAQGVLDVYVILAIVLAVIGVVPVYFVIGTAGKTIVGFGLAFGQGLIIVIGQTATLGTIEHIAPVVWVGLLVSAFAAIGIAIVPNTALTLNAPPSSDS